MMHRLSSTRTLLLFLLSGSFMLLACNFLTTITKPFTNKTAADVQTAIPPQVFATAGVKMTQPILIETPTIESTFDLSKAGLPPGFPIFPGAYGFSGAPGLILEYKVTADVRTTSEYYDEKMKGNSWTGSSTGGVSEGSCGGDCGPVPTKTPGPGPTSTPSGWMKENTQSWTSGTKQIMITFEAMADGGTDIVIIFTNT